MRILSRAFTLAAALFIASPTASAVAASPDTPVIRQEGCNTQRDFGYNALKQDITKGRIASKIVSSTGREIYFNTADTALPDLSGWGVTSLDNLKIQLLKMMRDDLANTKLAIAAVTAKESVRLINLEKRVFHPVLKGILQEAKAGVNGNLLKDRVKAFEQSVVTKADKMENLSGVLFSERREKVNALRHGTDCPLLDPRM